MVAIPRFQRTPACQVALAALEAGISVLPIKPDGSKQPAVPAWKIYQQALPSTQEVEMWFRHPRRGLALVTGQVSGGLIALDFDEPSVFNAWLLLMQRDENLRTLYEFIAQGYEEKSPKGGRHILFRCSAAFQTERRPGNQKLALRPAPPPKNYDTLAETREEGGLIIIDPSNGAVHPSGKPYVRLRGSVKSIKTITIAERELLYASVRRLDEVPEPEKKTKAECICRPRPGSWTPRTPVPGERPGDLFMSDPNNTWDALLADWDISEPKLNGAGHWERYLRHPGKEGAKSNCTLNADGTDRLFCFSHSVGLPVGRYLNKFEFYAYWYWNEDFTAAARALAEQGYVPRKTG